jgi:hypothetical protein
MNPFLQRVQASAELDRSLSGLSCTRFLSKSKSSKDLSSEVLLAALGKLHSAANLKAGTLHFDRVSSDRVDCIIPRSNISSSSSLEAIADTLSPTLTKAGWWRLEVTASPASKETRISMIRRQPKA